MLVEVWSDIACPWCLIAKRRFDRAFAEFEHLDDVHVVWRSFQLDPTIPADLPDLQAPDHEHLAAKLGASLAEARSMMDPVKEIAAQEGLDYDFDSAITTNTFDGHRLVHLASIHGLGAQMHERLMVGRLVEGRALNDHDVLVGLAAEVGIPAGEARETLDSDRHADDVRRDLHEATRRGIDRVPFFALDRNTRSPAPSPPRRTSPP